MYLLFLLPMVLLMTACSLPPSPASAPVKTGADILIERSLSLLEGKRVGIITNQTGRLSNGAHLLDALLARGVRVEALFGPEHGIRGEAAAGAKVEDMRDSVTGIPIYSLYGRNSKPTADMLKNVDVLIYDIQDVGARFYTYISTLGLCMEAAAARGIPIVVLDRPNPLGGMLVDGPVRDDSVRSFVGMFPIPIVYGLTCGELAQMINGEQWLAGGVKSDLRVVQMEGWKRPMRWEQTGLAWISPSPNIPTASTALIYPGTCFIEATNLSEGRGTDAPFLMFGAPFVDGDSLADALNGIGLGWVRFAATQFTPATSKWAGVACKGVRLELLDSSRLRPLLLSAHIYRTLSRLYGKQMTVSNSTLSKLIGTPRFRQLLDQGTSPEEVEKTLNAGSTTYRDSARRYMLYQGS